MFKPRKNIFRKQPRFNPLVRIILGFLVIIGLTTSLVLVFHRFKITPAVMEVSSPTPDKSNSSVWSLVLQSPEARQQPLTQLAQGEKNLDCFLARYLLAADYVALKQGNQAIPLLEGLDQDYPLLAPSILILRARASGGDAVQAKKTWLELVNNYSNHPLAPEGLFELGKTEGKYWDQAIANFPAHPRTKEILQTRLLKNPNQPEALATLAIYHSDTKGISLVQERLLKSYRDSTREGLSQRLKPTDWEIIALSAWQAGNYGIAADAYALAPPSALSAYRHARGKQLHDQIPEAKTAYLKLIADFPDTKETGLGLRRLASLTSTQLALSYLNQVITKFPEEAPQALFAKAKILEEQQDSGGATQARQTLLTKYANTEAAAELRWETASKLAEKGDLQNAWQTAQPITVNNLESEYAPEAAFWIGKWAKQLGKDQEATATWQHTIKQHPESYYAWRSAVLLGWDVGDFSSVRQKNPPVILNPELPIPPTGSELVKTLYRLGEYQSAWAVWRVELKDRLKLTVTEQFTDGLLRQGINDNLAGINQIWFLSQRQGDDRTAWQKLRQQKIYWQALFPFPFKTDVLKWSQEHQLNPLLVMSLIRQESRFETDIASSAGALGLMQVMPDTAAWIASTANFGKYDLKNYQDNLKLGTWYLAYNHKQYDNSSLMAIASYNAGAGNVAEWIQRFGVGDADAFVEKIPFPETYGYVKSVLGNYWNYLRLYNPEVAQKIAQQQS